TFSQSRTVNVQALPSKSHGSKYAISLFNERESPSLSLKRIHLVLLKSLSTRASDHLASRWLVPSNHLRSGTNRCSHHGCTRTRSCQVVATFQVSGSVSERMALVYRRSHSISGSDKQVKKPVFFSAAVLAAVASSLI